MMKHKIMAKVHIGERLQVQLLPKHCMFQTNIGMLHILINKLQAGTNKLYTATSKLHTAMAKL